MKGNTVRLTESQLHKVIKESVKKTLKEWSHEKEMPTPSYSHLEVGVNNVKSTLQNLLEDIYGGEITEEQQEWWDIYVEETLCERVMSVIDEGLDNFEFEFQDECEDY